MNRPGVDQQIFTHRYHPQLRPGQQPQRPPNLGPTPNMGGFRGPYQQAYGLPPRGVMQGYPNLQNHRAQSLVPQPSPGFIQQRTVGANATSAFSFGGNMQQQQTAGTQQPNQQHQQQQQPSSLPQPPQLPHPQPQPQGTTTNTVPPHLAQQGTPGLTSTGQNNSEVSLDPNDFPALGSGNTPGSNSGTNTASNANLHSSYATQAGTGVPSSATANPSAAPGAPTGQATRDFGPDDFPALGGQAQQQGTPQTQEASTAAQQHPPGINGFQQQTEQPQSVVQQHRQNLLGSMTASGIQTQQQTVLGQQTRGLHTGYDAEKRVRPARSLPTPANLWNRTTLQSSPRIGTLLALKTRDRKSVV